MLQARPRPGPDPGLALAARRAAQGDCVHRMGSAALALHGEQIVVGLHEGDRVDRAAVDPDFIVKVAAGRTSGRAHVADQLAASDALAGADQDPRKVAVAGFDAATMVDLDEVAVTAAVVAGFGDDAVGGRVNGGSERSGEVDALVTGGAAAEGIGTNAVAGGEFGGLDRLVGRN